ncbi:MAG TPA: tyrosine-type recombinase/integrase [Candidatus Binatia bacterium]|nr:tyrosine-type recombinase/integrase [Candidatus Binatia bacterium]
MLYKCRLPDSRGWHAFRRGLATNLNRLGVDDSVIQRILRHSNVAMMQACYIQTRCATGVPRPQPHAACGG